MKYIEKVGRIIAALLLWGIAIGIGALVLGFIARGVYSVWGFMF